MFAALALLAPAFAPSNWYWRWRGVATSNMQLRALEIEVAEDDRFTVAISELRSYQVKP
ncbi:TPA: type II secretion system protein [Yersinia enterocolitica]